MSDSTLNSICYSRGSLKLMDQRLLPSSVVFDNIVSIEDIHQSIKEMRVRGAPAIAISAVLGVAVHLFNTLKQSDISIKTSDDLVQFLINSLDYIATSRPTAVNLFNAVNELKTLVMSCINKSVEQIAETFYLAAEKMYSDDIQFNSNIMNYGKDYLISQSNDKLKILTICNTGALATARFGTALGVIRGLHYDNKLEQVYACETRPWNQGARLTVFECVHENMPVTLIADSSVSALMKTKNIDAVIVGADRICRNGDTANKIGTYNLAVTAKYHNIPFFVSAPLTTFDQDTQTGTDVHIEERDGKELTHNMRTGERSVAEGDTLSVWNPVFDITPAELITGGFITDKGVIKPSSVEPYFDFKSYY